MLAPGDVAPDFALLDQTGAIVRLSELLVAGPVVLFFYPAALSGGCTAEACSFRDRADEFAGVGAQLLGISADAVETQKRFADQNAFEYPLVSDAGHRVAEEYGVRRRFVPSQVKRATFVIGEDGVIIRTISSELRMAKHADDALKALQPTNPR